MLCAELEAFRRMQTLRIYFFTCSLILFICLFVCLFVLFYSDGSKCLLH